MVATPRRFAGLARAVLSCAVLISPLHATGSAPGGVEMRKSELGEPFLLQTSYAQVDGRRDFMTSRSRIVTFLRQGRTLRMIERHEHDIHPYRVLATIPVLDETSLALTIDFNAGFKRIFKQEDRTGEDYYGRLDREYYAHIRLSHRRLLSVSRDGSLLVVEQEALDELDRTVVVHYYLSPYRPNADFEPFEIESLEHFGFYETYPRKHSGRTVLYATKFDAHEPIVFALSPAIPARYRQAVRDGVRYWGRALGRDSVRAIDAPEGVRAPDPSYDVIEWAPDEDQSSTSHIQADPLTGEILHASIFVRPHHGDEGTLAERADHLRYVVAHEVGHALGLRHNFAAGPVTTVMNYFAFGQGVRIGNDVIESEGETLEYDRRVVRYVYLEEPLDVDTLPDFCTDNQVGCSPWPQLSAARRAR